MRCLHGADIEGVAAAITDISPTVFQEFGFNSKDLESDLETKPGACYISHGTRATSLSPDQSAMLTSFTAFTHRGNFG